MVFKRGMRSPWLCHIPVVTAVDIGNKGFQFCSVFRLFTKVNYIDSNVILLHLLCEFDKSLFFSFHRASDKHNDSLSLVLVLSMLQRQLGRGKEGEAG